MPHYKDLRFGDSFEIGTIDGMIRIRRMEHGKLEITGTAAITVGKVDRRIKTAPRMQPIKRRKVAEDEESRLQS